MENILSKLTCIAILSSSALAQAAPHNGYEPQIPAPEQPTNNCQWYQAACHIKYDIDYAAYLIEKETAELKNYANRYNTAYPIVLVHGVSGFDQIFILEYFQGIPSDLRNGNASVYIPNLTSWDDAYSRGEQLLDYIQNTVLPETGASKVNLIGHSLGSPTSRYVAGVRPDLVASVTSVNGINFGSGFADWGSVNLVGTDLEDISVGILQATGNIIDALAGNPEYDVDILKSVEFMSTERMTAFNQEFPDGAPTTYCGDGPAEANGIHYYSWGSSGNVTNPADISDALLAITGSLAADYFNGEPQDGLVGVCSMHWGNVLRDDYRMNHLDATNMLFGLHNLLETDPKVPFKNHADRLRTLNL